MDEPTIRHTLDEVALGLAHAGWVVRLQLEPPSKPATGHVVVRGAADRDAAAQYLVHPGNRHHIDVQKRRGGDLSPLGVAYDVPEVHALLRRDARDQPRPGQQHRPSDIDVHCWPRSA